MLVKSNEFKFNLHEDETNILISVISPVKSNGPAPVIVTTLSDTV